MIISRPQLLVIAALVIAATVAGLNWLRDAQPTVDVPEISSPALPLVATCTEPLPATAPRITSALAVECPQVLDGRVVTYLGEVVGDVLIRDAGVWVQLNDDPYALEHGPLPVAGIPAGTNSGLAVWIPDELRPDLMPGRFAQHGTVLVVTGRLLQADPADGGGTTIRATGLQAVTSGQQFPSPADPVVITVGILAAATGAAAWQITRRRQS